MWYEYIHDEAMNAIEDYQIGIMPISHLLFRQGKQKG